ncbi:MAG: hypothetical protein JRI86_03255 [Deltaproteobacteria bacterium]|nr:hypothetical protein [Deltaproteobacteria bacterium]
MKILIELALKGIISPQMEAGEKDEGLDLKVICDTKLEIRPGARQKRTLALCTGTSAQSKG